MPVLDESKKTSWADEVEAHEEEGPGRPLEQTEKIDGDIKTVTEYSTKNGKKTKIVSQYKIEKQRVNKTVAARKLWKKFGECAQDKPGPNAATTIIEEIFMTFVKKQQEEEIDKADIKKKIIESQKGQVTCRLCSECHWTTHCPYKDKLQSLKSSLMNDGTNPEQSTPSTEKKMGGSVGSKYVPPSMREGGSKKGESMMPNRDETTTIRVNNLSENTKEQDLHDLFKYFGDFSRIHLARYKATGVPKGFAFITFKRREEAEAAIKAIDGYGYDHLILSVEWSKSLNT